MKDVRIPVSEPFICRFARHSWFEAREADGGEWTRFEILDSRSGVVRTAIGPQAADARTRWGRRVRVLAGYHGDPARRMVRRLCREALDYEDGDRYRAWPGPNSNTFVSRLGRRVPGLRFELDHNAVGKDYVALFRAGRSTSGTGFSVDLPLLGVAVGLVEGVELHLFGLTLGVSLLPPALKIPFLPRIGFPSPARPAMRSEIGVGGGLSGRRVQLRDRRAGEHDQREDAEDGPQGDGETL